MRRFSTAAWISLAVLISLPISAGASIMGDLVDYDFTFTGSEAVIGGQSCSLGCNLTGQVTVGAGPELVIGPFTPNFPNPESALARITVDWDASDITFYAELLRGSSGQLRGSLVFSNLDWPGGLAEPQVSASPGINSTITSFDASSFTASIGEFTFASPRTINYHLVPEPSGALLIGLGLAALAARSSRQGPSPSSSCQT